MKVESCQKRQPLLPAVSKLAPASIDEDVMLKSDREGPGRGAWGSVGGGSPWNDKTSSWIDKGWNEVWSSCGSGYDWGSDDKWKYKCKSWGSDGTWKDGSDMKVEDNYRQADRQVVSTAVSKDESVLEDAYKKTKPGCNTLWDAVLARISREYRERHMKIFNDLARTVEKRVSEFCSTTGAALHVVGATQVARMVCTASRAGRRRLLAKQLIFICFSVRLQVVCYSV